MKNFIPDNVSKHDNVFDVLKERGFIEQTTDEEKVRKLLSEEKIKFYIGFDPTADCLHVGHFMQVIIMMYMQKYGHTPVVLLGGGTGMVGDPSGRTDMRKLMNVDVIDENCRKFKKLLTDSWNLMKSGSMKEIKAFSSRAQQIKSLNRAKQSALTMQNGFVLLTTLNLFVP